MQPRTINDYLARVQPDQRAALETIRETIRAAVPGAEECISYGVAAFRLNGRPIAGFGASAGHCSFYPMSGRIVEAHRAGLARFGTSKGSIRFQPDAPLPATLVRKLVRARMAEIADVKPASRTRPKQTLLDQPRRAVSGKSPRTPRTP